MRNLQCYPSVSEYRPLLSGGLSFKSSCNRVEKWEDDARMYKHEHKFVHSADPNMSHRTLSMEEMNGTINQGCQKS